MKNEKQVSSTMLIIYAAIVAGAIFGLYFINKPKIIDDAVLVTGRATSTSSVSIKLEDYKLIRDLVAQTNLNTENIKKIVEWINAVKTPETPAP